MHANDAVDDEKCLNLLQKPLRHEPPLMLTISTQTEVEYLPNNATNTTENVSKTIATTTSMSMACNEIDQFDEQHITQELTQHLENKAIQDAKDHHNHRHHHHHHHHHLHHQHNHSDSDSALSSAPTSISPQPPANGEEPTDIWQTVSHNSFTRCNSVNTLK